MKDLLFSLTLFMLFLSCKDDEITNQDLLSANTWRITQLNYSNCEDPENNYQTPEGECDPMVDQECQFFYYSFLANGDLIKRDELFINGVLISEGDEPGTYRFLNLQQTQLEICSEGGSCGSGILILTEDTFEWTTEFLNCDFTWVAVKNE